METVNVYGNPIRRLVAADQPASEFFEFSFTQEVQKKLSAAMKAEGWLPAELLFLVFQELLRRYTGQSNVTVKLRLNNSLPLTFNHTGNFSTRKLMDGGYFKTVQINSPKRDTILDGQFEFDEDSDSRFEPDIASPVSAIHCTVTSTAESLVGCVTYHRRAFPGTVMESFLNSYHCLLQRALENPDLPLCQLNILSEADAIRLDSWNRTDHEYPLLRVDQLFEQQAQNTPDRSAVTFEGRTMTYLTFSEEVSRLANKLRALGVGPNVLVGVCVDRCQEMVVALMAVFRAGGAYLPLDPSFPAERLRFMQEEARPLVVLAESTLLGALPLIAPHVISLDRAEKSLNQSPAPEIPAVPESSLDDLAYVLYTSGSTGKPKGVAVTHRALTNLISSCTAELPLEADDIVLATTTISFDISAFEIFAPLISGANLVVANRSEAINGERLSEVIRAVNATVLQATPSGWRILLESGWAGQPGLKMLSAGEPLDRSLADRLLERGAMLWNLYGPTEATIYATGKMIVKDKRAITIGKPLSNYTAYILDTNGTRLPVGVGGELYLGGIGVARGYLNCPELTAEKFILDQFSPRHGQFLYRTGDLARFLPDGQIELLGRTDNQIKLRGYRIELEEIEHLLDSHPAIRKSVVKLVDAGPDDQRLVAYIVARTLGQTSQNELRQFASSHLPAYMAPSLFVFIESFALTPNGKVDRKALPVPSDIRRLEFGLNTANPEDDLEQTVMICWQSILGIPTLDPDGNFFALGGHSLLAMRMCAHLGTQLGRKIPPSWLIEAPTPRAFANRLKKIDQGPNRCVVLMQSKGSRPPIYLVHQLLGDILIYRAIAERFAPNRRVYGIQPPADFCERPTPYPLQALASDYIDEILQHQSVGPFHLGGYSSGAVIAYEMARQLKAAGHEVGLLALIGGDIKAPPPHLSRLRKYGKTAIRTIFRIFFTLTGDLIRDPRGFFSTRVRYQIVLWRVRNQQQSVSPAEKKPSLEEALLFSENAYRPEPYPGPALLLRFHDEAWRFGPDPFMGWGGLVEGGIDAIDIPCGHYTGMSQEAAPNLASIMKAHIEKLEATESAAATA